MEITKVTWILVLFYIGGILAQDLNCTSHKILNENFITCHDVAPKEGEDVFIGIFSKCYVNKYDSFKLVFNSSSFPVLTQMPLEEWQWTNLNFLIMQRNNISNILPGFFNKFPMLYELDVSGNNISHIVDDTFASLQYLKKLNLDDNSLTALGEHSLRGLNKLNYLGISRNKINNINSKAFSELHNLTLLDLHDNLLDIINADLYLPISLNHIHLSKNKLNMIIGSPFLRCLELQTLVIKDNKLKTFDLQTINSTELDLDISFNNLETVFHLKEANIRHINSSFNKIKNLTGNSSTNINSALKRIDLGNNKISNIEPDFFSNMLQLWWLNLNHNSLESLPPNIFRNTKNLLILDLSFNFLNKNQDMRLADWFIIFSSLNNLLVVRLDHNPWSCAYLQEIIYFLKMKEISFVPYEVYVDKTLSKSNIFGIECDMETNCTVDSNSRAETLDHNNKEKVIANNNDIFELEKKNLINDWEKKLIKCKEEHAKGIDTILIEINNMLDKHNIPRM